MTERIELSFGLQGFLDELFLFVSRKFSLKSLGVGFPENRLLMSWYFDILHSKFIEQTISYKMRRLRAFYNNSWQNCTKFTEGLEVIFAIFCVKNRNNDLGVFRKFDIV